MQLSKASRYGIFAVVLVLVLIISPVFSSLWSSIVLNLTGKIQVGNNITAQSGSAADIQTAINYISSHGGKGTVTIPAGTFNFVPAGGTWVTVTIPAGVNVIGAPPSGSDSLGIPTSWATTLVMPIAGTGDLWDNPGPSWFEIQGTGNDSMPSRFANLRLVGYRTAHPSSVTAQYGLSISDTIDFRVDHCSFEHTCAGILVWGDFCCGVFDHNKIFNTYAYDDLGNMANSNVGYGIELHRGYNTNYWEPLSSVLGKYTKYTVFIENNYFSKWRHCISSGHGAYYVFRYNLVDADLAHYSLDVHGVRDSQTGRAGGRGAEIYENTFTNCENDFSSLFQDGGGCGVWFNNYVDASYWNPMSLYLEDAVTSTTWHLKDFYLWSAKGITPDDPTTEFPAARNVDCDWSRLAGAPTDANYPNAASTWSIAGYKPYTYPHPLVTG